MRRLPLIDLKKELQKERRRVFWMPATMEMKPPKRPKWAGEDLSERDSKPAAKRVPRLPRGAAYTFPGKPPHG
jgi:hypothetical protein